MVWNPQRRPFVNEVRIAKADLVPGDKLTVGRNDFLVDYDRFFGS
jgi:hypothetical protein